MRYTEIFSTVKIENFIRKKFDIFYLFAQSIDYGYMLEPPCRDISNEYPQSMSWTKNKKKKPTHAHPILLDKSGVIS